MKPPVSFLGPIEHLPAEGGEPSGIPGSDLEFCAALFSESPLWFEVTTEGATLLSNPQDTELFQRFTLSPAATPESTPLCQWSEEAYEISLQGLFPDDAAFGTLSDVSEPEDFVRRFLEVLSSSLQQGGLDEQGKALPLIRWQAGEDGNSARVQLLALLLANEADFEAFCQESNGELGFLFEEAEVQAHGLREALAALALLGITFGSVSQAEAAPFKLAGRNKESRAQQVTQSSAVRQVKATVPSQGSSWQDVHRHAYINRDLLSARPNGQKKIVVDISKQRAYLLVDGVIAIDTAVSTARAGKYTPRGEFKITERVRSGKTSTIYGCSLPYWQRLDQSAIGLHVGDLPGYPASAGCIRLPESVAPILFENTASGVTVQIVDSWSGPAPQGGPMIVAQVVAEQAGS